MCELYNKIRFGFRAGVKAIWHSAEPSLNMGTIMTTVYIIILLKPVYLEIEKFYIIIPGFKYI